MGPLFDLTGARLRFLRRQPGGKPSNVASPTRVKLRFSTSQTSGNFFERAAAFSGRPAFLRRQPVGKPFNVAGPSGAKPRFSTNQTGGHFPERTTALSGRLAFFEAAGRGEACQRRRTTWREATFFDKPNGLQLFWAHNGIDWAPSVFWGGRSWENLSTSQTHPPRRCVSRKAKRAETFWRSAGGCAFPNMNWRIFFRFPSALQLFGNAGRSVPLDVERFSHGLPPQKTPGARCMQLCAQRGCHSFGLSKNAASPWLGLRHWTVSLLAVAPKNAGRPLNAAARSKKLPLVLLVEKRSFTLVGPGTFDGFPPSCHPKKRNCAPVRSKRGSTSDENWSHKT